MNAQVLIDSIVRQVTVLIAQLATSGGIRAPVHHIANQVFVELSNELSAQGVSRKVSADMFGMALRAYIRKLRRLSEGQTDRGTTLWQAVLDFIREEELVTKERVAERFRGDGELEVTAILHDLTENGLVFCSGSGPRAAYRAASDDELGRLSRLSSDAGLEELLLALIYRRGPSTQQEIADQVGRPIEGLEPILARLVGDGRLGRSDGGRYQAVDLVIPLGATVGWEAAVLDHFQAMVQTICQRLRAQPFGAKEQDAVGGSTYSYDVWPGHPLEAEVKRQLSELRDECHELRTRVEHYNRANGLPSKHEQVVTYLGQCVVERELDLDDIEEEGDVPHA
jgi:hypothetical protein